MSGGTFAAVVQQDGNTGGTAPGNPGMERLWPGTLKKSHLKTLRQLCRQIWRDSGESLAARTRFPTEA